MHKTWEECRQALGINRRWFALTTKGKTRHDSPSYSEDDILLFGPETRGLPPEVLAEIPQPHWIRVPMRPDNRSLNLSNTVAIVVYEVWRQHDFAGASRIE